MTYISHIECDFQAVDKVVIKLRKKVQHIQHIVSSNFVQVAIRQRPHVAIRFT